MCIDRWSIMRNNCPVCRHLIHYTGTDIDDISVSSDSEDIFVVLRDRMMENVSSDISEIDIHQRSYIRSIHYSNMISVTIDGAQNRINGHEIENLNRANNRITYTNTQSD